MEAVVEDWSCCETAEDQTDESRTVDCGALLESAELTVDQASYDSLATLVVEAAVDYTACHVHRSTLWSWVFPC